MNRIQLRRYTFPFTTGKDFLERALHFITIGNAQLTLEQQQTATTHPAAGVT